MEMVIGRGTVRVRSGGAWLAPQVEKLKHRMSGNSKRLVDRMVAETQVGWRVVVMFV